MAVTIEGLSRKLVPLLVRRRAVVLSVAAAVSAFSLVFAVRLYGDLRSGIEELLPATAPGVIAVKALTPRLHSNARLAVDLEGTDGDALERFADALALRLDRLPRGLVEAVEYKTGEQDQFVSRFGPLYLPLQDLRDLRDAIKLEQRKANPLAMGLDDDDAAASDKPVDLTALQARVAGLRGSVRFRNGYTQTPDGKLLVLQLRPPAGSTGLAENQRLLAAVREQVEALDPASFDPTLQVGYSGEVAQLVEEQAALEADLVSSTVVVLVLVFGALYLYFRRWGAILAVSLALGAGCAITFGLAFALIGHLNANTAFLGSIVVGNGINVGIIFVARYLERRRLGVEVEEALTQAFATTLPSTFVAAFGAGLAYLSLATTDFRGFNQFGVIGALGMALCWATAYLLLPPLLAGLEARWPIGPRRGGGAAFGFLARMIEARPLAWLGLALVLLGAAATGVAGYRGDLLESDMSKIGARESLRSGPLFWGAKANQVFQASRTPVILHAEDPRELERALQALASRRRALGADDPLREVLSVSALVPAGQEEKLPVLAEIRALLGDAVIARLPRDQQQRARDLRASSPRPVTFADLPAALQRALSERDGSVGRIALVFPRKVGQLDLHELEALKQLLRDSAAHAHAQVQMLSTLMLLSDIDDVIVHDAPRTTVLALVLVLLLVLLVVRNPGASATVMAALLVGLSLLVGAAAFAAVRLNFLNFVVLPITFGIGVDYSVNIVQRFRHETGAPGAMARVLRETGSAVALCSFTTIIGYASLMVADSQALAGFGFLASLGEVTCLFAALFFLPAFLAWQRSRAAGRGDEPSPLVEMQPG